MNFMKAKDFENKSIEKFNVSKSKVKYIDKLIKDLSIY